MQRFEKAFLSDRVGVSIIDFLADELPLSKTKIKDAMQKGAVWLNRKGQEPERIRKAKEQVKLNDEIHIYYDASFLDIKLAAFQCVDECQQYSVWIKPEGLMDEVTLYGDHLSLERSLTRDLPHGMDCFLIDPENPAIYGLMLVAHTQTAANKFIEQQNIQQLVKDYEIIVSGQLSDEKCVIKADSGKEINVIIKSYNNYNNTTKINITSASWVEDDLKDLLTKEDFVILDEEELACSRIAFYSPINDQYVEYKL